jgi:Transposase and inactivated derivatives
MIDPNHKRLSIVRQCALAGVSRSSFYYLCKGESPFNLKLMRLIDGQWLKAPFFGSRRMAGYLRSEGYSVSRKRVRRLMRKMGLEALYPRPHTSKPHPEHPVYPYLLKGVTIDRPNQVWCADITFIPCVGASCTWWR